MQYKLLKISFFILILAFYASFLFYKIDFYSLANNDLGRHIKNGEILFSDLVLVLKTNFYSYTYPDFTFVNHHWLSGLIFHFLHQTIGFGGMVIFKMAVLISAFSLMFLASMKKAGFWLSALFSLPAILILKERVELRPEIFSYLFLAVFLYLLADMEQHPERKRIFWLIPLQLLWVNLHSFFILGILISCGFLFEKIIIQPKNSPLTKKLALLVLALVIVSFINPGLAEGILFPLRAYQNLGYNLAENQSLSLAKENYWWSISVNMFTPLLFLLAASFIFAFKRKPIFYFLAALGSATAVFFAVRTLPLFGLIFLPAISANFKILLERLPKAPLVVKRGLIFVLAAVFIYTGFALNKKAAVAGTMYERGLGLISYANQGAEFFREQNLKGPIFNDYDIGSYLIYHLFPREKVFVDNRPEAYPNSFFKDIYGPMIEKEEKWQEFQKKYGFNVIFLSQQNAQTANFSLRRFEDPDWSLIYADAYSIIFLKNTPESRDVIEKFLITPENIGQKIAYLQKSDKLGKRVQAINLLLLAGRDDLVFPALEEITAKWPEYSQGWLVMGEIKVMEDNPASLASAVAFMEKAINLGENTAEAHTFLGLAYFKSGQFKEAERAFKKALRINKNYQDAQFYLGQLQKYLRN